MSRDGHPPEKQHFTGTATDMPGTVMDSGDRLRELCSISRAEHGGPFFSIRRLPAVLQSTYQNEAMETAFESNKDRVRGRGGAA